MTQTFVTLDGVTQAPGAKEEDQRDGFEHGGWVVPFVDDAYLANADAMFERAEAFILGRATYEQFAFWWPQRPMEGDPVSTALNTLPKYVGSRTLRPADLTWENSHLIEGDLVEGVQRVKDAFAGDIVMSGSITFMQPLLQHRLVDELQILVIPVVVGPGHRLFRDALPYTLQLTES
ncbi:MAG: dihydrofolate reductase family protein, partial [Dehalococcoidia bacterium]